jgi:methylated-DNA-[protein]-cysteine S-methyltransferase
VINTIFLRGGLFLNQHERIHHYHSKAVGWLEFRVGDKGVRSLSFISKPSVRQSSENHPLTAQVVKELDDYFAGKAKNFSIPLDPLYGTPFLRRVWNELQKIPYGETRSYRDVAIAVGNPAGARAVGLANKRNCIAIVIPCHRVISSNGDLGGYDSGLHIKRALLELEGVKVSRILRKARASEETLIRKVIGDPDLRRSLFRQIKWSVTVGAKTSPQS